MFLNRRILAVMAAALLCAGSGWAVTKAASPAISKHGTGVPVVDGNLQTPLMSVKTSTHRKLFMSIDIDKDLTGDPRHESELNIELDTSTVTWPATRKSEEHHEWFLTPRPSTIKMSQATGSVSIATGKTLKPFTVANMAFKPSRKSTCGMGGRKFTGTLSGDIVFHTHTAAYGNVGSVSTTISFPRSVLTIPGDCGNNSTFPTCQTGFEWVSPTADILRNGKTVGNKWFEGTSYDLPGGETSHVVHAFQEWQVPAKLPVFREDVDTTDDVAQSYNATTHVVDVAGPGTPSAMLTGSATLTSDGSSDGSSDQSCVLNGEMHDEHGQDLETTAYVNGSPDLILHSIVNGNIAISDGPGAIVEWTIQ